MNAATRRLRRTGLIAIVVVAVATVALFSKNHLATVADRGTTLQVHFAENYKLRPYVSKVKVGFVPVGRVSGIEKADDGSALVSIKVRDDALDKLGSAPSATIRPTTALGGSYFVDLSPGGAPGAFRAGEIPQDRTHLPVELDAVAQGLQPDALTGLQHTSGSLRDTLDPQGRAALQRLLRTAPGTLRPGADVLRAAQGTRPGHDLAHVVTDFDATARALTKRPGQLERIVGNLRTTTSVLDSRSDALATALARMPVTLDHARTGLKDLDRTLVTLEDVAGESRPVAKELGRTLDALSPVLADARPVIHDLRYVARDARPLLTDLVPTARSGRDVLDDVRGKVIDRVNGPVLRWLYAPYDGKGPYAKTSSRKPMYQEITYALVDVDRASALVDGNGHAIAFQPGIGAGSVGGLPINLEQYVKLTDLWNYPSLRRSETGLPAVGSTVGGLLDLLGGN